MKAVIKHADDYSLPKIVYIVNKTNRFNMTTHIYKDAEIKKMKKQKTRWSYFRLSNRVIANGTSISSSFSPPW